VDEVIIFDEDTPYELIKKIKPDIITKGGDYTPETIVGNDLAEVIVLPYVKDYSTTNIVSKLND
jgi:D-beta-D-heptose 7-phosphate kinase/D-beta-D-heptose 1-phosphate adenosyltransferase